MDSVHTWKAHGSANLASTFSGAINSKDGGDRNANSYRLLNSRCNDIKFLIVLGNTMTKPKLGSGKRFAALTKKIEKSGKSEESAKAIAASVGRKKYGNKKMESMAKAGKKRK